VTPISIPVRDFFFIYVQVSQIYPEHTNVSTDVEVRNRCHRMQESQYPNPNILSARESGLIPRLFRSSEPPTTTVHADISLQAGQSPRTRRRVWLADDPVAKFWARACAMYCRGTALGPDCWIGSGSSGTGHVCKSFGMGYWNARLLICLGWNCGCG
jgi:hypothetical protein